MTTEEKTASKTLKDMTMAELGREAAEGDRSLEDVGEEILSREMNLDLLISFLGDKVERDALSRYKHNEEWALRSAVQDAMSPNGGAAWATMKEKLRAKMERELAAAELLEVFPLDEFLDSIPGFLEDYMLAMVRIYQKDTFDPLVSFEKKLAVQRRAKSTITQYMNLAANFVGRFGRKRSYTDVEITDWLYDEQNRVGPNTYCMKAAALKTFCKTLDPGRPFPVDVRPYNGETCSPCMGAKEVAALIMAGCIWLQPVDLLRLAVMTIYGARVSEVAALSTHHIDLPNKTITIPVRKRERSRPQPVPDFLLGVFSAPIRPCGVKKLQLDLKRWCRLARIKLAPRFGVHAIRRAVATALDDAGVDILSLTSFGRWSTSGLGAGVRYIKNRKEAKDLKVLAVHPFVQIWKEALPYVRNGHCGQAARDIHLHIDNRALNTYHCRSFYLG